MEEVKNEEVDKRLVLIPQTFRERLIKSMEYLGGFLKVTIKTKEQYDEAADAVRKIKSGIRSLDEGKKEITSEWHKKKSDVDSYVKEYTTKLKNGYNTIESGMKVWLREEEIKRNAAQKILEAEAEEKRRKAEEAATKEAEKVEKYMAEGKTELADKAAARMEKQYEKADTEVAPVLETHKAAGTSTTDIWLVRKVDNMKTAVEHLLSQPDLEHLVSIDIKKIEKLQNTAKGKKLFPGISFKKDYKITSRG